MPYDLASLPVRSTAHAFHVVVESPRGSGVKLKFEPGLGAIMLGRPLPIGLVYPFDWGFVPGTCASDGDPLDAVVLFDQSTFPGVVIACRGLGVIRLTQKRKEGKGRQRNDRIVAVPICAPRFEHLRKPQDLSKRQREELEQFFLSAVFFENKDARLLGWGGAREAETLVDKSASK
jgi:inorganic pyrophosphatase